LGGVEKLKEGYELLTIIPVNVGNWKNINDKIGFDRGERWREFYFSEAIIDWSWLPPNCVGKLCVEMKHSERNKKGKIEVQLAWVKARKDGGAGNFNRLEGAIVEEDHWLPWDLYESDYFPLPTYKRLVLLYLMGRAETGCTVSQAMFTLAVFKPKGK